MAPSVRRRRIDVKYPREVNMSRKMLTTLALALGALGVGVPVSAHHSFSSVFDASKPVELSGVLAEIKLENPHSWFYIDVTDASGKVVRWGFEGSTPTSLIRSGYKPSSLKVGDQVTVKGSRARDMTKNQGAARSITLKDGRSFIVGPLGTEPDQ
jgi:Family of unknown function (DUF6152)